MPENLSKEDPENHPSGLPQTVLGAGLIVLLEGLVGVGVGVYFLIDGLRGHEEVGISAYGTAAWFIILFGAVLAAGIGLLRGQRWGRGIGIITQVLLAPVMFALFGESNQPLWGTVLLVLIVPAFVMLVMPKTSAWMSRR
ncbi:DUF7144 family membrane protein [Tomitella biformata]|uniref:DUF7144 family membrane protein n=1 Tax=Tomitella biformata TaxID=630403 RepID=UPI0004B261E4|nr:hypothetical protein [Tomitella biformata]